MDARIKAFIAALVLAVSAGAAKVAHLGPFADDVVHLVDTTAMSSLAFKENYLAMKAGTLAEQQALDIACGLFSSVATSGSPPEEWTSFRSAFADRMGAGDSGKYFTGKVERLAAAVELAEQNPRYAAQYAKYCVL